MDDPPLEQRDTYLPLVFTSLWENLPGILMGGIIFSIMAMPAFILFSINLLGLALVVSVLTITPAWAALLAYEFPIFKHSTARWKLYWSALLHYWRRSIVLGAVAVFPLFAAYLNLPSLNQEEIPIILWLSFAADFFMAAVIAALSLYVFPLMVRDDLGLRATVRNAWILIGRRPINTVGLLGMGILFGFAVVYLSLGLLFLLPAVFGLFVVGNCESVLQQT